VDSDDQESNPMVDRQRQSAFADFVLEQMVLWSLTAYQCAVRAAQAKAAPKKRRNRQ
jgi:hypothetical protein